MIRIVCCLLLLVLTAPVSADTDALARLRERAESGDAAAQVDLGARYRDGEGVERDYQEAVRWYRLAAEAGSAEAMDHLGFMYLRGFGVPVDFARARALFERAAELGSAQAMFNLGRVYAEGLGVPVDRAAAETWWGRATEAGNRHAPLALGLMRWHADHDRAAALLALQTAVVRNVEARRWWGYLLCLDDDRPELRDQAVALWKSDERTAGSDDPERPGMLGWLELRERDREPGAFVFFDLPHRRQGLNMCAPTAAAIATGTLGRPVDPYAIKARCTGSPTGTGTDWALLVDALMQLGRDATIRTFTVDDAGFDAATVALRAELDAGRPALIDVTEPKIEARSAHTVVAVGYERDPADGSTRWILHDPAAGLPGLWIVTDQRLRSIWRSRWWTRTAPDHARPMITIRPRGGAGDE